MSNYVQNYLNKLFDVFEVCEDIEDTDSLKIIFELFKNAIMLDEAKVYDALFSEENIMKLMGALECKVYVNPLTLSDDPTLPKHIGKAKHREYLSKVVTFKEVVPFSDPNLKTKIHQTYRIQYLKDTVLPQFLDDNTFNSLNTIVLVNNMDICQQIRRDDVFLQKL